MMFEEIDIAIKEIDNKIVDLQDEQRNLYGQRNEAFKKEAQKHIGRCFKINGEHYVKVVGVPEEQFDMNMRLCFNEYLFPAIFLDNEEGCVPFVYDVLHSEAWGVGGIGMSKYEEISQDEFNAEFKRRIDIFRNKIMTIGDKTCLTCRMYDNPSDILCTSCDKNYSNYEPVEDNTD